MRNRSLISQKDFFISYSSPDRLWAEWIAWQLKREGYTIELPGRAPRPGANIVADVADAAVKAKRTIVVLSPDYLNTRLTHKEWNTARNHKRTGKSHNIFPIKVRECEILLEDRESEVDVIDLVGKDENTAKSMLLDGIRHSPNESQIFDTFTLPPVWNIHHKRNQYFTNREDILLALHKAFRADRSIALSQPLALIGLEGIGKTQIAIEYAYRYRDEYQCLLWTQANSLETLESSFVEIAKLLHLSRRNEEDSNSKIAAVKHWLQENAQWLLIFDNVDELEIVNSFIPAECKGDVLLTTRIQSTGTIAQPIEVSTMNQEDSVLLILRRANKLSPNDSPEMAFQQDLSDSLKVAKLMDGLPLALDQAGAYIEETGCSLAEYVRLYHSRSLDLLRHRGEISFEHPKSIALTWSLSFKKVQQANPAAATLLCLCSFLYHEAIPEEILIQNVQDDYLHLGPAPDDQFALDNAIEELRKYSFIQRSSYDKTLSIHRLVQVVLMDSMEQATQKQWAERVVCIVNRFFPEVTFASRERCRRYIPHVDACADLIEQWKIISPEAGRLLHEDGSYWLIRGQYGRAEQFYQRALAIREAALSPDDPAVVQTLDNLTKLYLKQEQYIIAESLCKQALNTWKHVQGENRHYLGVIINRSGEISFARGDYSQARELYQEALHLQEEVDIHHPLVADIFNNLAEILLITQHYSEAESYLNRAIAIRSQTLGSEHPALADSFITLAHLNRYQNRLDIAGVYYKKALTIREGALDTRHPDILSLMRTYLSFLEEAKRDAEAASLQQRLDVLHSEDIQYPFLEGKRNTEGL